MRLWGLSARDVVAPPGPGRRSERARSDATDERPAALARPVRRGPVRRAARVHRQPAVRPPPRGRRPRRLARARARCSSASACSTEEERAGDHRRARPRRGGARRRARSRSRRPTRTSTPRSSAASPRSRAPTGAKLHTGRSRNDQVALDLRLYLRREGRVQVARASTSCRRCCCAGPRRRPTIVPARLHAPAARAAGAARAPSARALLGARPRRRPLARLPRARRRVAARRGRARRLEPAARPATSWPTSSASRAAFENSLDAVSDRDFVAEALFVADAHAGAPLAPRRGDRAVVDRGVRLPAARRRVLDRLVDAAAEEEPRHRRARAGQGRPAHRRPHRLPRDAQGPAARVQPRSAGGQGAAVRRARHVHAVAARADAGCSTTVEFVDDAHDRGRRQLR